jgi:SAM-dependent methyltransferase
MQFCDLDLPYQTFLRDLFNRFGFDPDALHLQIPSRDEMFFKGVLPGYPGRPGAAFHRYMESSLRTYEVYRQLSEFKGGFANLGRVLDFGSGHGRLTRLLTHRMEAHRIWTCDIYPEAVAWQAQTFGVNGVVSVTDPDKYALDLPFGIVFVGSVFSHLPDGLFQNWLARLFRLTAPDGLLAFTVHDHGFAPAELQVGSTGLAYAPHSESDTLDPAIYGMSYVTESYVAAAIRDACGPAAAANSRRFPRAVYESQDLWVIGGAALDVTKLKVAATPIGSFAKIGREGQPWIGWGLDPNPGARITRANLFVGDTLRASQAPQEDNLEVMKFFPGSPNVAKRWAFDPIAVSEDTMVRVELTSTSGTRGHCYALAPFPARPDPPRA